MRVIVIGGGVVGLCVAESLARRDCEVTVLERDRCGAGASTGNAGWVTPSLSIPVPGPGVIGESLRWLVNPSGPLWITPTLSPGMWAWIARFMRSCSRAAFARGLAALQRAAERAPASFDRLAERGIAFELHDEPLIYPAFERAELEQLWTTSELLRDAGSRQRLTRLSPAEIRELEPALGGHVLGGVIAEQERRVRPERFTGALHRALQARGVAILEQTAVSALVRQRSAWGVVTSAGSHRADAIVLACGVPSGRLVAALGIRLPIVAAKGYSRTYPADPTGPRHALYLEGPRVAVSTFEGAVRVSGTLELGARTLELSARRLAAITAAAQRAMPSWQSPTNPSDWAGMRSLSPDGLPFVGALPGLPGVHVATAHATLGITLAPLTGELLAELLTGDSRDELLTAFDPARAVRRHNRQALTGGRA